jgi:phage-related protein
MNAFIIDSTINSRTDLGLRITEPPVTPPSRRIINSIEVDGREGTLTMLRGWNDIVFNFKAGIIGNSQNRHNSKFREMLPTIINAKTVYFSNDSDVFYNVKHVVVGALERKMAIMSEFALTFTCSPFRYIRSVETVTMTASGNIDNTGTVYSLPKITVYGTGSQTLTINGKAIILNILQGSLVLDSELKTCYYGNVAQNNQMRGDFPVFEVGNNTITLGSGITKIEIEPRWRYI